MTIFSIGLDLLIVLIVVISIKTAYQRGFMRSIVALVGYILSIFIAINISNAFAPILYENTIKEGIVTKVNSAVSQEIKDTGVEQAVSSTIEAMPDYISKLVTDYFGGEKGVVDKLSKNKEQVTSDFGTTIADEIVAPIVIPLIRAIMLIVVFAICIIIVNLVARLFQGFYKIPILGGINSFLGGVLGIFKAIIIILILVSISKAIISMTGNNLSYFNSDIIESSFVFKYLYQLKLIQS